MKKNNKYYKKWKKKIESSKSRDYSFDTVSGMNNNELYFPNDITELSILSKLFIFINSGIILFFQFQQYQIL